MVQSFTDTDISFVRLNPCLRYANEIFGTDREPDAMRMSGISPGYQPHLRVYDGRTVENPFSESCEGATMTLGAGIPEEGEQRICEA